MKLCFLPIVKLMKLHRSCIGSCREYVVGFSLGLLLPGLA